MDKLFKLADFFYKIAIVVEEDKRFPEKNSWFDYIEEKHSPEYFKNLPEEEKLSRINRCDIGYWESMPTLYKEQFDNSIFNYLDKYKPDWWLDTSFKERDKRNMPVKRDISSDNYLYHVTYVGGLEARKKNGLKPGSFLTTKEGIEYWIDFVSYRISNEKKNYSVDDPKFNMAIIRVKISDLDDHVLYLDRTGSVDSQRDDYRAMAFYTKEKIPSNILEVSIFTDSSLNPENRKSSQFVPLTSI